MMNRQRLNPLRQQQQLHHHHVDRGHEATLSPRTPQSPQAVTVRRKVPCTRPDQTTSPAAAPLQATCVSRGRGKGSAMAAAPIVGDWGTRMAKTNQNNVGRRGAPQPPRNQQPTMPRVSRLSAATRQDKMLPAAVVATSLPQPLPPIVSPPSDAVPVELLTKSPYLPSGSDIQSSSLPDQTSSSSGGRHRHRIKLANAIRLPDQQNKSFVYLCKPVKKVKELLTARRMRQSDEHLDLLLDSDGDIDSKNLAEKRNQNNSARTLTESNTNNQSALSSTTSSLYDSLEILQKRQQEIEAHFPVFSDKSYQHMLQNQLRDVRQQEEQLQRLANKSVAGIDDADEVIKVTSRQRKNNMEKLVCQNIPTLQNEIKQLQQLGEKLEATLRASACNNPIDNRNNNDIPLEHIQLSSPSDDNNINNSSKNNNNISDSISRKTKKKIDHHNNSSSTASQSSSLYYTPRSILPDELAIRKIGCLRIEQVPIISQRASILAALHYFGCIKEFRIEMKTLNEIKTGDDTQCFYMPVPPTNFTRVKLPTKTKIKTDNNEIDTKAKTKAAANIILAKASELRSTSFRKLRENPKVLIHQLRPKSPMNPFNLLEQDTMFISSLAYPDSKLSGSSTSINNEDRERGGGAIKLSIPIATQSAHDRLSVSSQTFSSNQLQTATTQTEQRQPKLKPSSSYSSLGNRKRLHKRKSKQLLTEENAKILKEILTTSSSNAAALSLKAGRRRQHKPRQVGPCGSDVEPKIHMHLTKTVVVGLIQIAVFLVLIMAFTYPDIRC